MHINNIHVTTAPKNLTPWRDSNPGSSVLEAGAMTTMPSRQGERVNFFIGVGGGGGSGLQWYFSAYIHQCKMCAAKINCLAL
jgi:hypothetical protein